MRNQRTHRRGGATLDLAWRLLNSEPTGMEMRLSELNTQLHGLLTEVAKRDSDLANILSIVSEKLDIVSSMSHPSVQRSLTNVNLGDGGIAFNTVIPAGPGAAAEISWHDPFTAELLNVRAEVVSCTQIEAARFYTRFRFIDLTPSQAKAISATVSKLQLDQH